jgi:hypothetical protein
MTTNPLKEGALTANSVGLGTVTREMVRKRAFELAASDGRPMQDVSKSDWEQARRELTGDPGTDPKDALLEAVPESEGWEPVHGSSGHKIQPAQGEDEDEEGRSDKERLVAEGIEEAEHDQRNQAVREDLKK